jgi:hypothetical protein
MIASVASALSFRYFMQNGSVAELLIASKCSVYLYGLRFAYFFLET